MTCPKSHSKKLVSQYILWKSFTSNSKLRDLSITLPFHDFLTFLEDYGIVM